MRIFEGIKILYVCEEDMATTYQRRLALSDLNVDFEVIFTNKLEVTIRFVKRLFNSFLFRLGFFPERNNENLKIISAVRKKKFDIIFIEKGLSIKPSTLKFVKNKLPEVKIVSYTLDDMMNPHNSSYYYKKSLPLYDFHFTNKNYNVDELKKIGAKNVFYFRNAFSKHIHRPVETTETEKKYFGSDVSFIGTYENDRKVHLMHLADNGIKVKVWGWGKKYEFDYPNITFMGKHVYKDEYSKVVCSSKISLCFLRKANRDNETTRTIELPACGGFMLAERTPEHLNLFEEGKEAEYFESKEELSDKVKYYLENDNIRNKIGKSGYEKCIKMDYSYHNQLSQILKIVLDA